MLGSSAISCKKPERTIDKREYIEYNIKRGLQKMRSVTVNSCIAVVRS